jgi:hypothetical protein
VPWGYIEKLLDGFLKEANIFVIYKLSHEETDIMDSTYIPGGGSYVYQYKIQCFGRKILSYAKFSTLKILKAVLKLPS